MSITKYTVTMHYMLDPMTGQLVFIRCPGKSPSFTFERETRMNDLQNTAVTTRAYHPRQKRATDP